MLAFVGLQLSTVRSAELVGALQQEEFESTLKNQVSVVRPVPEAYNVANPIRVNITVKRDTECKNCPFGGCLNAGIMWAGTVAPVQCWTQGETVGDRRQVEESSSSLRDY
jgi:hypothetical protein